MARRRRPAGRGFLAQPYAGVDAALRLAHRLRAPMGFGGVGCPRRPSTRPRLRTDVGVRQPEGGRRVFQIDIGEVELFVQPWLRRPFEIAPAQPSTGVRRGLPDRMIGTS